MRKEFGFWSEVKEVFPVLLPVLFQNNCLLTSLQLSSQFSLCFCGKQNFHSAFFFFQWLCAQRFHIYACVCEESQVLKNFPLNLKLAPISNIVSSSQHRITEVLKLCTADLVT